MAKTWWFTPVRKGPRFAARSRVRLGVEQLEDRCVPAVVLTPNVVPSMPTVGNSTNFDLGTLFDDDNVPPGSISVRVQWGDTTTSFAKVAPTSVPNTFDITGTHTYAASGPVTLTLTVSEGVPPAVVANGTAPVVVVGLPSTTTLTSSLSPSLFGQTVTFTAVVAASGGSVGTPTGSVTFVIDGAAPGTVVPLTKGTASFTDSSLSIGPHTIKASYSGDSVFASSTDTIAQTVNPAPIVLAATLANWTQNAPKYDQAVYVSGGAAPLAFSLKAGVLPPGLALDAATGHITGTPTTVGTFKFSITASDAAGDIAGMSYTVTISAVPNLTPAWFPILTVGVPVKITLKATGGTGPTRLTYTIQGSLPPGLKISPFSDVGIITISGTPTAAGTAGIMVFLTDSSGGKREICGPLVCVPNAKRPRWSR